MRIRIIFKLRNKGATLPFQHQHLLTNLVENMMKTKFSTKLEMPLYNFSGLKGQTKVARMGLSYLSNRVTLVMSSMSQEFLDSFLEELFKHSLLEIGEVILTPEFVEQEVEQDFKTSIKYLCLSPLVPSVSTNSANLDTLFSAEMLSDMLYDSTMHRMEKSGLYTAEDIEKFYQFQLIPDKDYLQKLFEIDKKASRPYYLYQNEMIVQEIIGYTFPFELYAHPKVQEFISNCGFGEFTTQGYGMLDRVSNTSKTVSYPNFPIEKIVVNKQIAMYE